MARSSVSSESAIINKEELPSPRISMSSDSGVDSSLRQMGNLYQAAEIVRSVLYATPDNVLTVYEIYRQVSRHFAQFLLTIGYSCCLN